MKRIGIGLLIATALQTVCFADSTNSPSIEEKVADVASRFHEIHSVTNLPPAVFKLCVGIIGKIADPGQKWQESDAASDESLPWTRMIWAVTDDRLYVVHYESMGSVHQYKILSVEIKLGQADPDTVQNVSMGKHFKNFRDFLEFNYKK